MGRQPLVATLRGAEWWPRRAHRFHPEPRMRSTAAADGLASELWDRARSVGGRALTKVFATSRNEIKMTRLREPPSALVRAKRLIRINQSCPQTSELVPSYCGCSMVGGNRLSN